MKKYLVILLLSLINASCFAGVLEDKFNEFTKKEGVSVEEGPLELKKSFGAKEAFGASQTPGYSNVKYLQTFGEFQNDLPKECQLKNSKLADMGFIVYFSQPTLDSEAEVIMIYESEATFLILTSEAGVVFKENI